MSYKGWNTGEVIKQLKALGFGQYLREFQMHEIQGPHLPLLTEDHLKEMGVSSVGDRILMLRRFSDIASGKLTPPRHDAPPARSDLARAAPKRADPPPEPAPAAPPRKPAAAKPPPPPAKSGWKQPQHDWSDSSSQMSGSDKPPPPPQRPPGGAQRQPPKADVMPSHKAHETYVSQNAADGHVTCQYCGRPFAPDAAKRHIPVCGRFKGGKIGKN